MKRNQADKSQNKQQPNNGLPNPESGQDQSGSGTGKFVPYKIKMAVSLEGGITLFVLVGFFGTLAAIMGGSALIDAAFTIAYKLLIDVCLYIMSLAVLMGGLAAVLSEFGVVAIFNRLIAPLMRPVYDLPGAASVAIMSTFLSDNPAVLTLSKDRNFSSCFRRYQMPALTNLGTSFGMGLMVIMFILRMPSKAGESHGLAVIVGLVGAMLGSIISTRMMLRFTARRFGKSEPWLKENDYQIDPIHNRIVRSGSVIQRLLDALLEGGRSGVDIGLSVIPGVLIICTLVTLLTNQPTDPVPGVGFLPWVGSQLQFLIRPLLGFASPEAVTVPITALGSAGASLGIISNLFDKGLIHTQDLAVMTAMCMCWSGYLSTHVAMMDALECRDLTGKAILSHTIGGLFAGIFAHYLFRLVSLLF